MKPALRKVLVAIGEGRTMFGSAIALAWVGVEDGFADHVGEASDTVASTAGSFSYVGQKFTLTPAGRAAIEGDS